jgi:hypothetical protein
MSNLLKQAIADAKAVRATALANAKMALEEHFAPKLQSMLATKLQQEIEGDDDEESAEEFGAPVSSPESTEEFGEPVSSPEGAPAPQENPLGGTDDVPVADAPAVPETPVGEPMDVPADVPPQQDVVPAPAEEEIPPVGEEGEDLEREMEEELLGQGNPDPTEMTDRLTEIDKASPDYKKTTSGHKTEDPGKQMIKSKGNVLNGTPGGPKEGPAERTANSNYRTGATGKRPGNIRNIKAGGTHDPQGPSEEFADGPRKDQPKYTNKTLEESDMEDVNDETLDEILKELESEAAGCASTREPQNIPVADDEEVNLAELFESDDEDEEDKKDKKDKKDDEDEKEDKKDNRPEWLKENISLKKELQEYRSTVQYLRDRINEVNLLNAKLLYTNKLFKQANLTNEQKLKVIESFDLTKSVREARLIYATLTESFNFGGKKVAPTAKKVVALKTITEGLASKLIASTKPTTNVLNEGSEMANRFKKLAGIRTPITVQKK